MSSRFPSKMRETGKKKKKKKKKKKSKETAVKTQSWNDLQ